MATEIRSAPMGEVRSATTAGGGTALTSTAVRIPLLRNTKFIEIIPRNFSTAVVVKYNFNPYLIILKTTDLLTLEANLTDYSDAAQDLSTTAAGVDLSSLSTLANNDAVYVGSWTPFGGVQIDVDTANVNASVLTVTYWNGSAWTDISATDGTDNAGASMGQDGNVTWTVPTAWVTTALEDAVPATAHKNLGILTAPQYWTRWVFSAALDATTTQDSWIAINRDTTYGEIVAGQSKEQGVTVGPNGFFSITALTDAGTANLIVNCFTLQPPSRF